MITNLDIAINGEWESLPVYNRVEFDERLDEQLDSGIIQTINQDNTAYADYSLYRVTISDNNSTKKEQTFFGFDTVEKRGENYYVHTIELVEPTRIIMGMPIDGCKVTQSIAGKKKTLYDVVFGLNGGLISKAMLIDAKGSNLVWKVIQTPSKTVEGMRKIISPEFHWECGTLLWECLCDIGNVINSIPKAIVYPNREFGVDFVPVNDVTAEYEL